MEHLQEDADENVVSFNLSDLFDDAEKTLQEIDSSDIPDKELVEVANKIDAIKKEIQIGPGGDATRSTSAANSNAKNSRFASLTNHNVDEIAEKSVKKTTLKQTSWGVKIFRG